MTEAAEAQIGKRLGSPALRVALGLAVSGACLYLLLRDVPLRQVGEVLAAANLPLVGLALLSVAANTLAKAVRWQVLLGPPGKKIPFFTILMSLLSGQMLNTLLPARLGEVQRAYTIGGLGPGRTYTLGTVALEKILDLLAYAGLFLCLLLLIPLPAWIDSSIYGFVGVTLAAWLAVLTAAYRRAEVERLMAWGLKFLPAGLRAFVAPRLQSGLSSLEAIQGAGPLFNLAWLSAVVWGTALLNNHLALLALGLRLPLSASLLTLIALQAGISLPSAPGKIGVFETICVLALSVFGVGAAQGLAYGLLLHAVVLLPSTLLGLLAFWKLGMGWRGAPAGNGVEPSAGGGR